MDMSDLLSCFGTASTAARALHLSDDTVRAWKRRGIPLHTQYYIEAVTEGRLLAPPLPYSLTAACRREQIRAQRARRMLAAEDAKNTQQMTPNTPRS